MARFRHPIVYPGCDPTSTIEGDAYRAKLLRIQGGKCAICESIDVCGVDHDHVTGTARGWLCSACNTRLGWAERRNNLSPEQIEYLRFPPSSWTTGRIRLR